MAEYRKVQLTEAPTIEIGDINDITGTIHDKGSTSSPYIVQTTNSSTVNVGTISTVETVETVGTISTVSDKGTEASPYIVQTTTSSTVNVGTISSVETVGTISTINDKGTEASPYLTGVVENLYNPVTLFSSTNISSEVTSDWVEIKKFRTKTISIYSANASGTLTIEVTPTSSTATAYQYYQDTNIAAGTFTTKSFTEAFYYCRIKFNPSAASTIDAWIGLQT